MIISSGLAPPTPSMKLRTHPCEPDDALGRLKPNAEKVNETGTVTSEKVHLGEIAVIFGAAALPDGKPP